MAKYETMLITSAALDEEASAALVGKFKSLIEANGTIDSIDEWGKRRLAYPINDEEEGVYTVINFTSEPSFPAELDRVYKITEGVMRSLIVVDGRLQSRQYQDKTGANRTAVEVVANNINFAGPKSSNAGDGNGYQNAAPSYQNAAPARPAAVEAAPSYAAGNADDFAVIDDSDDLPF